MGNEIHLIQGKYTLILRSFIHFYFLHRKKLHVQQKALFADEGRIRGSVCVCVCVCVCVGISFLDI